MHIISVVRAKFGASKSSVGCLADSKARRNEVIRSFHGFEEVHTCIQYGEKVTALVGEVRVE